MLRQGPNIATGCKWLLRLARCRRAQGLAEYGLLLVFLSFGAAASSLFIERQVTALLTAPVVLTSVSSTAAAGVAGSSATAADVHVVAHVMVGTTLRSGDPRPDYVVVDSRRREAPSVSVSDATSENQIDS
jgi:hypothetical protein